MHRVCVFVWRVRRAHHKSMHDLTVCPFSKWHFDLLAHWKKKNIQKFYKFDGDRTNTNRVWNCRAAKQNKNNNNWWRVTNATKTNHINVCITICSAARWYAAIFLNIFSQLRSNLFICIHRPAQAWFDMHTVDFRCFSIQTLFTDIFKTFTSWSRFFRSFAHWIDDTVTSVFSSHKKELRCHSGDGWSVSNGSQCVHEGARDQATSFYYPYTSIDFLLY